MYRIKIFPDMWDKSRFFWASGLYTTVNDALYHFFDRSGLTKQVTGMHIVNSKSERHYYKTSRDWGALCPVCSDKEIEENGPYYDGWVEMRGSFQWPIQVVEAAL